MGWCRLCDERAVAGSMFCVEHRQGAARLTQMVSLAEQIGNMPLERSQSMLSGTEAERRRAVERTESGEQGIVEDALERAFDSAFSFQVRQMVSRSRHSVVPGVPRWPQISTYFRSGRLMVRCYFSIIPKSGPPLPMSGDALWYSVRASLAPEGVVRRAYWREIRAVRAQLQRGDLQTVDLRLQIHQSTISIHCRGSESRERHRATFVLLDDQWVLSPGGGTRLRNQRRTGDEC